MADFKQALPKLYENEGGYVFDPVDPGGETYKGIARKENPQWAGWGMLDAHKAYPGNFPKSLDTDQYLQAAIESFYKKSYWDPLSLDQVKIQSVALELFDIGVNMGISVAGKFLQTVLNLLNDEGKYYPDMTVDGKVGPETIHALNAYPEPYAIEIGLHGEQYVHFKNITLANTKLEKYFKGWILKRVGFKID